VTAVLSPERAVQGHTHNLDPVIHSRRLTIQRDAPRITFPRKLESADRFVSLRKPHGGSL
jgi:hypothetical protein